jgi:LmbE family N-acetylglucosaminyl deacetylase
MHLILSPHFDDAALSLGGLIRQRSEAGERVRVLTLFAGRPGADLSPLARRLHRLWGDPADLLGRREEEDRAALAILGAEAAPLGMLDALYRRDHRDHRNRRADAWLYAEGTALYGPVHPAERGLPAVLAAAVKDQLDPLPTAAAVTVYAPLAVGDHVDHQLAHAAARRLTGASVCFYEDFPYAERPGLLDRAREARGGGTWAPRLVPLTAGQLSAKIAAIRSYSSQLGGLFRGEGTPEERVRSYAAAVGGGAPAERLWIP